MTSSLVTFFLILFITLITTSVGGEIDSLLLQKQWGVDDDDLSPISRTYRGEAKMIFVELSDRDPESKERWTGESIQKLEGKWFRSLRAGGFVATVTSLYESIKLPRLMVVVNDEHKIDGIVKFFLTQREVHTVVHNNEKVKRHDFIDDDDEN